MPAFDEIKGARRAIRIGRIRSLRLSD